MNWPICFVIAYVISQVIAVGLAEWMNYRERKEFERTKDPMDPGMLVRW